MDFHFWLIYTIAFTNRQKGQTIILYNQNTKSVQRMSTNILNNIDVLPTIKRICSEQGQFSHYQRKGSDKNGLQLKQKLTSVKIKNLVSIFVKKLKRNLINAKPVQFELKSNQEHDEQRMIKWTGWNIQAHFQGFILFLDIVMSLITYFMGAFQGFLDDFKNGADTSPPILILKLISMVIFVIRLILAMTTVDYEDDTLYLYITDIVKKQLAGGGILLHIFSLVMVVISLIIPADQYVGIIFFFSSLLKLLLIRSNLKILQLQFIDSIKKFYIWNLIRVIIFNIIFAHTIAAVLLATARINPDNNWITVKLVNNNFVNEDQSWYMVYFWSYYWACTIMMTVGFGDISPVDYRESIVVAFVEIFSSIVLAYNISEVGSIVTSMRKSSQELERKLGVLRRMLKKNPVPEELQCKIESYLTHELQIKDRFEYNEHRAIIEALPQQLKQEYFFESNQRLYQSIPVLRHFQKQCLSKLNRAFQGKVYYPGQYILKSRTGSNKVIIMKSGKFGLAYWKPQSRMNGSIIQSITLEQSALTGSLITTHIFSRGSSLNYDIISQTYSYGMQMKWGAFINILKESNIDYYYYKSVIDRHEKLPNTYDYVLCEYCQNQYHTKFQCTRLHYIPTKSQRFLRFRNTNTIPVQRNHEYDRNIVKPYKNCLQFRKKFFSIIQKELIVRHDETEEELNVDEPYDYFMYFKEFNPSNFKQRKINRSKWTTLFGAGILSKFQSHRDLYI